MHLSIFEGGGSISAAVTRLAYNRSMDQQMISSPAPSLPLPCPSPTHFQKMFSSSALLSLLLVAVSVANASPIQRDLGTSILKVASQISLGSKTLVELDLERCLARHHKTKPNEKRTASEVVADNGVAFTAQVGFGSPPTQCACLASNICSIT